MDMTTKEFRAGLDALGMTQEGFAEMIGVSGRTGQRWANNAVPPPVATLMRLLLLRPELVEVVRGMAREQ